MKQKPQRYNITSDKLEFVRNTLKIMWRFTHDGVLNVEGVLPRLGHGLVSLQNYMPVDPPGYRNGAESGLMCLKKFRWSLTTLWTTHYCHQGFVSLSMLIFASSVSGFWGLLVNSNQNQITNWRSTISKGSSRDGPPARMNDGCDSRGHTLSIFTHLESVCPSGWARPKGLGFTDTSLIPFNDFYRKMWRFF